MYPTAREWSSKAAVTITTTPAQLVTEADVNDGDGPKQRRLRWIGLYPDGTIYMGGSNLGALTVANDGFPLLAGEWYWFEVQAGFGPHFAHATATATCRVMMGFE